MQVDDRSGVPGIGDDRPPIRTGGGTSAGDPYFGLNQGSNNFASNLSARVSREQFEDYRRRFLPTEQELIQLLMDPAEVDRLISEAGTTAQQQTQVAAASADRQMSRLGVQLTPDQRAAMERSRSLTSVAAEADARNRAAVETHDRRLNLMAGG